jgi:uncharacterized protein
MYFSTSTGADIAVVRHFAYLHDSQRVNEGDDVHHGTRAKDFVVELVKVGAISLNKEQIEVLKEACEVHNTTRINHTDPTIATCLDDDRLDLWRMGIQPSDKLLFTEIGKQISQDKSRYDRIVNKVKPITVKSK